jgi:hypothetical protein
MIGRGSFHWFACLGCYWLSQPGRRASEPGARFRCDNCSADGVASKMVGVVSLKIPKGGRA